MHRRLIEARKQIKNYTAEQILIANKAYMDVLRCWNIGLGDEEVYEAQRKEAECRADWAAQAAEEGLFDTYEDFNKLVDLINDADLGSIAYC